jgi:hypothetical protein
MSTGSQWRIREDERSQQQLALGEFAKLLEK